MVNGFTRCIIQHILCHSSQVLKGPYYFSCLNDFAFRNDVFRKRLVELRFRQPSRMPQTESVLPSHKHCEFISC